MKKEYIFNFWIYCDATTKFIHALAGQEYYVSGNDDENLEFLESRREIDYFKLKKHPVPDRYQIVIDDVSYKGITSVLAMELNAMDLFEEVIRVIERKVRPKKINKEPLVMFTYLHINKDRSLRPILTEEDTDWFNRQFNDSLQCTLAAYSTENEPPF